MNYIELSLKNVEEKSKELFDTKIKDDYDYDLVIFIAKGSYLIGKSFSDLKRVPLLEIKASRSGGNFKKILKPFFKLIPKKILMYLRRKEITSTYHDSNQNRNIRFDVNKYNKYINCKNILLVDDSVDSGYSVIKTKEAIENFFVHSNIKVAVINTMSKSVVKPDYSLYVDTMICGPWSNDSKYNSQFLRSYREWKKVYDR